MLFDRTQSPLSGKRIVGAQARRLGLALGLALLASLPMGRAHVASAANVYPPPSTIVTPWSWQQFKQSLGLLGTADTAYVAANPSSSTVAPGTALSNGYLQSVLGIAVPAGLTSNPDGTEVRGFVLGDYGTLEPNSVDTAGDQNSTYNFFEAANSNNITQANITGWFSPLYAISNARDLVIQTVDDSRLETGTSTDNPTQAGTVTNNGFTTITNTAALGQVGTTYEEAVPTSTATFSWTLTAPTPGYYTIYANIPEGTGAAATAVPYTIVSNGVTTDATVNQSAHGYQLVGGVTTTANTQTIVVTVIAPVTTATTAPFIYADSVQLRQPRQVTIDNTDPPTTAGNPFEVLDGTDNFAKDTNAQDFTGTDYLESPLLTRVDVDNTAGLPSGPSTAGASFVDWIFPIQTTGSYALSAYYPEPPSADNADDTFTPEYYSTDAEYTVKVYPVATAAALTTAELRNQTLNAASTDGTPGPTYVQTALINQSINGGQFRQIFSQLSIPAGSTAVLQLDNTSDNTGDVSGTSTPRIVVADAAQLNPDDGSVYGTPVAANVSDYPELRYGYNTANAATTPTGSTETGLIGGFTATSGGGQPVFYTAPFLNPTTGSEDANTPQYHGLPNTATATDLGLTAASTLTPDSEITYFGRTENLPYTGDDGQFFGTPGPAQQSGAMYAVDGLNGNIIWKYGTTNTIIDDSNTVDFTTTGFGASQAAPATDFYGAGYRTAPATTAAGTANTLATWTLPLAEGSGTAEYAVYAWFPSATASTATPAEAHISDAQYTISDSETVGNTTTIVPVTVAVSQVTGGKWVPINNPNRTDNAFVLGFGSSSVTLSNANPNLSADYTNQVGTTAATPNPVVAADAVMFVPLNNTGTIMSTPLLVRQMNVLTQAGTYQPRDVVIFTDNLGKMYCVDAAGNQDADNTLIDEDTGDAVSLDSAGYPAVGLNGTTGTNTTSTGITLPTPYNLTVRNFGTTTVYWIWQPSAATDAAILHTTLAGTGDSIETAPDASRDMPAPSSFLMNSPTAALAKDPNNPWYDATLFVGNPNGTLYSLNANGIAANATLITAGVAVQPTEANVTDYKQYRLSQNATVNTVDVNWWFNTGEAISYAPAFDPSKVQNGDQHVYVTTYSSSFNNQGHLYSIDAGTGGVGNGGLGFVGSSANTNDPGSFNYNVNPVSYWSFPDKYGAVKSGTGGNLSATNHFYNSLVADGNPALPLGDMSGSPNVETLTSDGVTRILVCANDPGPPSQAGNTGFGRVYSVEESGKFNWAYPATNQGGTVANGIGPNSVGETDAATYATVYNQGSYTNNAYDAAGSTDGTLIENDFTTQATSDDLSVSSSVATAVINFPTTPLTDELGAVNATALTAQPVPMAYVGTLGGHLLALDLNGGIAITTQTEDVGQHLISDTTVGQSAPIYSTPAILPGSAGVGKNVGGTIYLNAGDPALYELEALPVTTADGTTATLPVEEQYFIYDTLGAVSSPSLSAFDTTLFTGLNGQLANTTGAPIDVEFVYTGTDNGFCVGLTPNATTANPGGGGTGFFDPGSYIPSGNLPPPTANTSAPNKFIVVRLTNSTNKDNYNLSHGADVAALYDWGQTAYIQVYGVYQPTPASGTTGTTPPYSVELTYSLSGGGKQTGGSQTVMVQNSGNVTVQTAKNLPTTLLGTTGLFDTNQTYVATFPITIGATTATLPGTRRTLRNLTLTYTDVNGATQTIRLNQGSATRFRQAASSAVSTVIRTPLPASLTILNPLAVTGGGRTLDNEKGNFPNMGELGPVGGINGFFYKLPNTPSADATGLGSVTEPLQEAEVNGNPVINGTSTLVAVGLGDIAHNTAGDSSLGSTADPGTNDQATDPHAPGTGTGKVDATYGNSLLLVTDRSAEGTVGQSISNVYMSNDSDSQLAWNDNSGQEGPGSVINNLSWDTAPVDQHQNPTGNPSPDYPNIPASNLSATLIAHTGDITGTIASNPKGVSATITNSGGTLVPATSNAGAAIGDPDGTRTVYPMATIVKVAVPKYTPANLEVCTPPTATATTLTEITHTDTGDLSVTKDVPEGYYSKTRVYIDLGSSDNHRFDPNTAAYRDVAVMIGVPVDMGMSVDQPTIDLGAVTAGFADQTVSPWEPYRRSTAALGDPTQFAQSSEIFGQYYQPITVRNNGNVNLMNVHVDSDVYLDGATAPQSYVRLTSDQAETPYPTATALEPSNWTDSLSFIPSIDNSSNLLLNDTDTNGNLLLRSSLDTDVYLPNPQEEDLNGNINTQHSKYTNATLHKARPGDAASTTLTVPDEPHDTGNPAYISLTKTNGDPSVPYYGQPVVGIAVPLGTPVGTYSGTVRTYEGSDPYIAGSNGIEKLNNGLSGTYSGPQYAKARYLNQNPGSPKYQTAFYVNNVAGNSFGVPEQYYSDPGTTLKIAVRETRFTDGPPLVGAAVNGIVPNLALPSGDPSTVPANGAPLPTSDVQPFVFSVPNTGDLNLYNMGLLFVSNRDAVASSTSATANVFDLFTSTIGGQSATASALTAPSGANSATWWTKPGNQTNFTVPTTNSALASQVSSPFVLSVGSTQNDTAAFFILRHISAASTVGNATLAATNAPVYTIYEAQFGGSTGAGGLPLDLADAVPLYTSTDPIFGVHAVEMPDTSTKGVVSTIEHVVVMWQARVRGRSRVEYITGVPTAGVILAQPKDAAAIPQELPVSSSLVDVQSPSPVLRYIANSTSSFGATGTNALFSNTTANALDVAYSGSLQDGTTDIYTSRYYLAAQNGTTLPTLTRIAVIPQAVSTTANPFTTTTLTLTRSGTDTGLFYAREVDWAANIDAISIGYTSLTVTTSQTILAGTMTVGTKTNVPRPYTFDKASGQIVYTGVNLPWTGTTGTVYVNPGLGTVRFSAPPTDPTTVITATVVPLSDRITYNSRTNSEPVAFLDDTLEPAIATSTANTLGTTAIQSVNVSREWFIYRKSGSASGATSATNDTLYYDTRRLTAVVAGLNATTSFATTTSTVTNGTATTNVTALPSTFKVSVTTDPAYGGLTDVTNLVDVDVARARVYFPSTMEGMYAQVTYIDQNDSSKMAGTQAVPLQIEWQDEPYVNSQTPSVLASGEHVLPIAAAANESNPSAFLDPTSGLSNGTFVPHRVWVFWSSTRNAAQQAYTGGTGSTGSDLYYESMDPNFEPNLP